MRSAGFLIIGDELAPSGLALSPQHGLDLCSASDLASKLWLLVGPQPPIRIGYIPRIMNILGPVAIDRYRIRSDTGVYAS